MGQFDESGDAYGDGDGRLGTMQALVNTSLPDPVPVTNSRSL